MLSIYTTKRIRYATSNKGKNILQRYRTANPNPETFWQAFFATIRLFTPLLRSYGFYKGSIEERI